MKKVNFFVLLSSRTVLSVLFLFFTCLCLTSCGDDDSDSDGYNNQGGVNVNGGLKIVQFKIEGPVYEGGESPTSSTYNIQYDSKGRVSEIILSECKFVDGRETWGDDKDTPIASVDYDLRVAELPYGSRYSFSLNEKGYISQIGNCSCTYDDDGYLIRVDSPKSMWSLTYSDGDLVRSLVSELVSGNTKLYYLRYGGDLKSGELYFYINTDHKAHKLDAARDSQRLRLACLVAYQVGLFGKVAKHCKYLSDAKQLQAQVDYEYSGNSESVKCSFVCE